MTTPEAGIIGALLEANGSLPASIALLIANAPESFDDARHGQIAVAVRDLRRDGMPADAAAVAPRLRFDDSTLYLMGLGSEALPLELAEVEAESAWKAFQERRARSVLSDALQALEATPSRATTIVKTAVDSLERLQSETASGGSVELLQQREFKPNIEPPPLRPIYTLAGIPISTPANLTTITSAIKTGKSAVIGAMVASVLPHHHDADLLGFSSTNPKNLALLWFDSEQSPDDSWHCNHRALLRAGQEKPPAWLHAYCLTGLGHRRAWECVIEATKLAAELHGGIHSVLIDGFADLVADVNDAEESNSFVAELHDVGIKYDCPIIGVIHFNPNSEKSRGHLGSQLERKAETNLALEKDAKEITVIYSTKNRRAGIPKGTGPRFMFSPEAAMHITVECRESDKDSEKRQSLLALAEDVFRDHPAMRYSDIITAVSTDMSVTPRHAERKVGEMARLTVIRKAFGGMYEIAKQASTK